MAQAVLSLLQFILVQVLVRTNDGGRKAVREYIVINDELRDNLSGMPHAEWGHHIDAIIRQEKRRIRDQILEMYIRNEVDRREAILFIPPGVTVMKREGFWRYATPPVNIGGVPLPFTMIYLFICPFPSKTTFWICTGIILFFVILDRSGWTVRTICTRIFSILRGAIASGRPWWYRHHTESPRDWTGLD